jgi:hypothetical protein
MTYEDTTGASVSTWRFWRLVEFRNVANQENDDPAVIFVAKPSFGSSTCVLFTMRYSIVSLLALIATTVLPLASSKAILGVDLGSLYMKVALVQRGAPLEIVTNLHSKRKTENMILFDQNTRFFGSDASSLLARKPLKTPSAMSVLLGKEHDHPTVQVR